MAELRIGVLTASDSRAGGEADDTSGRALIALAEAQGWSVVGYHLCKDDQESIEASLIELCDVDEADVVLTTGGTGLGPRDVTPEATIDVCDREVPGIAEAIRSESLKVTGRAMLSRAVAAVRGTTLVINLPGSEKAVRETFAVIAPQLEHAVGMMAGEGHPAAPSGTDA
ncbi:MAG: MogA/MoaB family molybdenum cofactor biosynthesis protein [Actinobacteria bacterium]|nr:MAG: MogA/MoaB family molybdenum cofactor biosynthesis protein [Actinomycetota bacterium]